MKAARRLLTGLVLCLTTPLLWAQEQETVPQPSQPPVKNSVTLRLELWDTILFTDDDILSAGTGSAELIYRPAANDKVKGELKLKFFPSDGDAWPVDIEKCFARARFDRVFVTLGKTRLSWGEGRLFNAGDLLYGSLNPLVDLTGEELRTETAWLTAVNFPLWSRAFAETVWLPAVPDTLTGEFAPLSDSRAGGRLYWTPGQFKVEAGYLWQGTEGERPEGHNIYLSLHGVLWIDWYAAGSWTIGNRESLTLSAGLYHMIVLNPETKMTLRFEALVLPGAEWEEQEADALSLSGDYYGLYLYPEVTLLLGESGTISLSSVISPVDSSAMITLGGGWNIYQGLTLLGYGTVRLGEKSDIFAWNNTSLTLGMRYVF